MGSILEEWFVENQRDFPWRVNRTPYRVWISEVMLQQTRASVVIPYFLRWMELFPDVKSLYLASMEQVIKAWEGLGYYSRARNIKAAAAMIIEKFHGEIPSNENDLRSIKGFGPYTVGAILSFAFQKKALAIDGNVTRVITRLSCIDENIAKSATRRKIIQKTEEMLDPKIPWMTSEALIELGATICTPKPRCGLCPMRKKCVANLQNKAEYLPVKTKEMKITQLFRIVFVFKSNDFILVRKGTSGKIMADLYEFPYIEVDLPFEISSPLFKKMPPCSHTFTRFKANLFPYLIQVERFSNDDEWVELSRLKDLPFSSGHRKILTELGKLYTL